MKNNKFIVSSAFLAGFIASSLVQAQQPEKIAKEKHPIADVQKKPDSLSMIPKNTARNVTMSLKGPDGLYMHTTSPNSGKPISIDNVKDLQDGVYHYEYSAASNKPKKPEHKDSLNHGRNVSKQKKSKVKQYEAIHQSGYFVVKNGKIVVDELEETAFDGVSE